MSSSSTSRLQQLPYSTFQEIALFLGIDDRYAFAETCVQICDAVDTDKVWMPLPPPSSSSNQNDDSIIFNDDGSDQQLEHNNNDYLSLRERYIQTQTYNQQVVEKMFPKTIENPIPIDPGQTFAQQEYGNDIIYKVVAKGLPDTFRFKCNGFKRFQFLVVHRLMSRSCRILRHDEFHSRTIMVWHRLGSGSNQTTTDFKDEKDDCMPWAEAEIMLRKNKILSSEDGRRVKQWLKAVSKETREMISFMEASDELRAPAQIMLPINLASIALHLYFKIAEGYCVGILKILTRFEWTSNKFKWWINELQRGLPPVRNILCFPRLHPESFEVLREQYCHLFSSKEFMDKARRVGLQNGWLLLDMQKLSQKPGLITKGILAAPTDVLIVACLCFGTAASYQGGRVPSLHHVPPKYASRIGIYWKLAFDVLRSTAQQNFDAAIFFIFSRWLSSLAVVGTSVTTTVASNRFTSRMSGAVSFLATRLIPFVVREGYNRFDKAVDEITKKTITEPFMKYIGNPVVNTCTKLFEAEFGAMSKSAALSLVVSGSISVAISLISETQRTSFKKTVTRQRFRQMHSLMSHAAFTASLALLRWRLYGAGYSFWKTVAVESLVRMSVSVVELIFARRNRFWNEKIKSERRMEMQERRSVFHLDYWESDEEWI